MPLPLTASPVPTTLIDPGTNEPVTFWSMHGRHIDAVIEWDDSQDKYQTHGDVAKDSDGVVWLSIESIAQGPDQEMVVDGHQTGRVDSTTIVTFNVLGSVGFYTDETLVLQMYRPWIYDWAATQSLSPALGTQYVMLIKKPSSTKESYRCTHTKFCLIGRYDEGVFGDPRWGEFPSNAIETERWPDVETAYRELSQLTGTGQD